MQDKKCSPIKFGTGGWRAIIGDLFTKENIRRVAWNTATGDCSVPSEVRVNEDLVQMITARILERWQ